MGAAKLLTAAGGAITLDAASTATDKTITIPARTGNLAVDGPAFSAYNSGTQTVSTATNTKLVCNTESFDTASCFDSTTNYRFTPNVAGYYQVNVSGYGYPSATGIVGIKLYKNGSEYFKTEVANSNQGPLVSGSSLVYLNGSTDYIEIYAYQNSGGNLTMSATDFSASMVRAA